MSLGQFIYEYGVIQWKEGFTYGCICGISMVIGIDLVIKIIKK